MGGKVSGRGDSRLRAVAIRPGTGERGLVDGGGRGRPIARWQGA
jgi:hypothetical protein